MKSFSSIEKLDTGILYVLELTSSLSVLLLAFGLIASMANVLTKGSVLTDNLFMQRVWAWTQCVAIDASVAGTIIRTFRYHQEREKVKTWLYGLLSALLLFTAAIVLNIESVQQTLNLTLEAAYVHVFIPVEALIWVRSLAIVLLIVAHAMRHVGKPGISDEAMQVILAKLEKLETLEQRLARGEPDSPQQALLESGTSGSEMSFANGTESPASEDFTARFESKEQIIAAILERNPTASVEQVMQEAKCSERTANKWMKHARRQEESA